MLAKYQMGGIWTSWLAVAIAIVALGVTGCGGGGGGGGSSSNNGTAISGSVIRVETGLAPLPSATISVGGQSTKTTTGSFNLSGLTAGNANVIISAPADTTDSLPAPTSLTVPVTIVNNATTNIGPQYLSAGGYTASFSGTVETLINGTGTPVSGATVTLANQTTTTAADGTFSLSNLPVGLGEAAGNYGSIKATGYAVKIITDVTLQIPLAAGANSAGVLFVSTAPSGSSPAQPYTITGTVVEVGTRTPVPSGTTITLSLGGNPVATTTTNSSGAYYFWVVPGNYTVSGSAIATGNTVSVSVALVTANNPVTAPQLGL